MPTNKQKRKASPHTKAKTVKGNQKSGLITSHRKTFVYIGLFFVAFGIYLLTFKSHDSAMFGLAMISLIAGVITAFYASFTVAKKTNKRV